jgi:pimeloyl-ACP methyl ester carboxylesterase
MIQQRHTRLFIFLLVLSTFFCQAQKTIYCFPGQGSDARIFDSLIIDQSYQLKIIDYGMPEMGMSMKDFALQLSERIDTTEAFLLIGVSLGGMICAELAEIVHPEKTIIISSAKNRNELPARYKFQRAIPLYKIFSGRALLRGAKILQPIVEPDRKKNKATFINMLGSKNPEYMKRTINLLINWDKEINQSKIYHIHGSRDHTLPIKKITSPDVVINSGSHMMTLTKASEVSAALNDILTKL